MADQPKFTPAARRAAKRREYITVKLTPTQLRLCFTEMNASADNCDNAQLGREYRTLANKFRAAMGR